MRRRLALALALVGSLSLIAVPATAANVHWVGTPQITRTATSITTVGKLAGVGNKPVTVVQSIDVAVTCSNPGKNTDVPGQRKSFHSEPIVIYPDNGNISVNVTTSVGSLTDACPNGQWTASGVIVGATLTVSQGGKVIFSDRLI